jgi:hypothetical protein
MTAAAEHLFEGADWDFPTLQRIHDACEEIARLNWASTPIPTRSRSSPRSRCWMPIRRSACRCSTSIGRSASTSRTTRRSTAGLLLAACIGVAAIAWQSSYGDPESPAIARMPDQRGCNGKRLCPPSQPPHEYGPGIRPKDATNKKARTPRSRGCSVVVLYNEVRTHLSLKGCAGTAPRSAR